MYWFLSSKIGVANYSGQHCSLITNILSCCWNPSSEIEAIFSLLFMSQCEGMYTAVKAGNVTALERKSLAVFRKRSIQQKIFDLEHFCDHTDLKGRLILKWALSCVQVQSVFVTCSLTHSVSVHTNNSYSHCNTSVIHPTVCPLTSDWLHSWNNGLL